MNTLYTNYLPFLSEYPKMIVKMIVIDNSNIIYSCWSNVYLPRKIIIPSHQFHLTFWIIQSSYPADWRNWVGMGGGGLEAEE